MVSAIYRTDIYLENNPSLLLISVINKSEWHEGIWRSLKHVYKIILKSDHWQSSK